MGLGEAGVAALQQLRGQRGRHLPGGLQLGEAQGQQAQHGRAPGQTLADGVEQQKILRASEHIGRGRRGLLVYDALQVGEQAGHPLHLIEHRALRVGSQKPARVSLG